MEKSRRKLFVLNPTSPMVVCFPQDCNLLLWEKERIKRLIHDNGGLVISYEECIALEDHGCVFLAEKDYEPHSKDVFDVIHVDDCIREEWILDISKYKLGEKPRHFCSWLHTRALTGFTDHCIFTDGVSKVVHDLPSNIEEKTPQKDLKKIVEILENTQL